MQQFIFPYELSLKAQMPEAARQLLDAAEAVAGPDATKAPGYRTGAALLLTDGSVFSSSGGPGCAEASVLEMSGADEAAKVKALAIVYLTGDPNQPPPLLPCGACRQLILELQRKQGAPVSIYIGAPDGEVILVEDAAFLLPFAAGTRNL